MRAVYKIVGEIEDIISSPENAVEDSKVYTDLSSGHLKFTDRPEGNKLMLEIENGIVTELYVYSIDRFGKNARDILSTINLITSNGCNVIAEKEGLQMLIDGKENPIAKMVIGILSTLSDKTPKEWKNY
ncbi:recombinase family protein [Flavobacterium sp. ACAM 123]|jgi:DNA invertase Pin-like site-specific DNA recombinase|uniref:recombinase family protein n=1 Tax=Flavobacterium sp. ACAM 123 TaxID=1189620 RepID=UPI0002ECA644|nr:recombinase family protein [Flavobacterium sp. ACAM 123]